MSLFVKTKTLKFSNEEVIIKEIGVNYLLMSEEDKMDTKKVLELHTSLSKDEVNALSIHAYNLILDEFYALNKEHFSSDTDNGEDGGK